MEHNVADGLIQSRYEEAVTRNNEATQRLNVLIASMEGDVWPAGITDSVESRTTTFAAHLEDLRVEEHCNILRSLSSHLDKAAQLAQSEKVYQDLDLPVRPLHAISSDETKSDEVQSRANQLLEQSQALTAKLELAVVEARQLLKREQALLNELQAQVEEPQGEGNLPQSRNAKLRALRATRDELQGWIGDSLAKCEQDQARQGAPTSVVPEHEISDELTTDLDLNSEYDTYVRARSRLLKAMQQLRTSLPESNRVIESENPPPIVTATAPKQSVHQGWQPSPTFAKGTTSARPPLIQMQRNHLSQYHHLKLLNSYLNDFRDRTLGEDVRLLQALRLLSHESHLLSSHPRSNESKNAALDGLQNRQQNETSHLLHGWAHASRSAEASLGNTVRSQIDSGVAALSRAMQSIEQLRLLEQAKKEVLRAV